MRWHHADAGFLVFEVDGLLSVVVILKTGVLRQFSTKVEKWLLCFHQETNASCEQLYATGYLETGSDGK